MSKLPSIAKLASKYGIVPLKKLGQNFIFDESLCDKIVKASNFKSGDLVLEVGAGTGGLTRSILKNHPSELVVIETDKRCIDLLKEIKNLHPSLKIKHLDALKLKLADLELDKKINIISNLPYNIGTTLLTSWLHQLTKINSMVLMLQKEVVERIVAKPGTKSYGRLSVICQLTCHVKRCFNVSPDSFYPKPQIWSSVVKLEPKENILSKDTLVKIEKLTNIAFSSRRKMIKSSLGRVSPEINNIIEKSPISNKLRPENLSPQDYLTLSEKIIPNLVIK